MKRCPRCPSVGREAMKPLSEFGICRARPDGLNLYCKSCIREKIGAMRQLKREMRAAQKAAGLVARKPNMRAAKNKAWVRRMNDPAERVLRAIEAGAKTQRAIRRLAGLTPDKVSDAL